MVFPSQPGRTPPQQTVLAELRNVRQFYHKDSTADVQVLDDVNLTIHAGEIVGLLGRSGSGKSTLLRIIAGLLPPTSGEVLWKGEPLKGPTPDVAIVFQSFALFPWMTIEENVALGLDAKGVPAAERDPLVESAIDLIGLGGYENAWPKELSGGMQQRVGLARALVVNPALLLMDEPFSALDVLTAENLRTDLVELWSDNKLPVQSMLIVTHNIEEAVLMCDRIVISSSNPGRIAHVLPVPFPHPRNREDAAFRQLVDHIYALMTQRAPIISEADLMHRSSAASSVVPGFRALVPVSITMMIGMMEALAAPPLNGRADLPILAEKLQLELDDLFPLGESLELLALAELEDGDILLTNEGVHFVLSDLDERKAIMGHALRHHVPLVKMICALLDERPTHSVKAERFRDELEACMSPDYARQTLQTIIGWTRFAELFDYDEESDRFFLPDDSRE
ncbi:MAG: nitrate/sulfonate/bicarbonate ABC transporter ATP-binding protein [Acetobacter fabarum]|jgi:NitT/TauT family transport system ATP-binding protein|uniref:ABC transporter ATP-binding protein n=1 Tax=Acetobacter sp. DsW_54 TaxID=1670660 RepID=UPI000A3C72F3|nr:nitrate/sulfonate/bicarbonate ABC transporter ATP-binding protein [Acetobacter sp. DsW_54]MCI1242298.1 nitrate/sulfonate/bicarbonate ABC transporter ATP-binding protein [Acetobacter fabarum]MCI1908135.1 nitrate/sulfonate/bicarbonate ABC transporter ATP-binding protein [Acetobacter fabarum]MCI1927154.1 nitrate/sulfonate/bicarbonate ABC transporter ATP-binding protein [Acetobacter fabarum]MCI1947154.1 nitrate/sulfonate/bicarbonate ABC transporter ATP-binding protein [Acetobacter fabarum]MCI19